VIDRLGASVLLAVACGGAPAIDAGTDAERDASASIDGGRDAGVIDLEGWRVEPSLPFAVQEISVEAHDGRIWVAGGFEGATIVRTVRIYDPATRAWSEGPALPAPRHHMSLVSFDGDLYGIGGMDSLQFAPLATAWRLRDGAWEDIAPLPIERGASAAVRIDETIVVVGGNQGRGELAIDTLIYEPAIDEWRMAARIPTQREHLAAVAVDGEVWALAGRMNSLATNTSSVEIYDPIADAWRDGPAMPNARGGFGAAVLDGAVYAVGGEQPDRALDTVDRYDIASMTWSSAPPVPTPRHGHGVVALGDRIWVVGGADEPIFAAVDAVESYAP
jgi:N-acetylneuraminic acid mutarotase